MPRIRSVSSQIVIRPRADTREIVMLELLPIAAPVLAYGATQVFVPWGLPLALVSIAVTAIVALVLAARDRSVLESRGFGDFAPSTLALVSPILYIVIRARACRGHDREALAPLPWAIGATVVAGLLFAALAFFEGSLEQSMGGIGDLSQLAPLLGG